MFLTLIILWTLSTKVVSVRQKFHVPYTFAFFEIVTNRNNFLMLSCSLFHLSCHLKRYLLSKHFFPEALVILSKRRALGERKVCDKFPFPILDSSREIEFLCSKCSCPCFMLVKFSFLTSNAFIPLGILHFHIIDHTAPCLPPLPPPPLQNKIA